MPTDPTRCPDCGKPYEDCDAYLREEAAAHGADPRGFCSRGIEQERPALRLVSAERALAAVTRALDDEEANLADDGARLSHTVVRRLRAILSPRAALAEERDAARAEVARLRAAVDALRNRTWQEHLTKHPSSDGKSCPYDYGFHDALTQALGIFDRVALPAPDGGSDS